MERCEVCGNEYDKVFQVLLDGRAHHFDCFECAIHALAPVCQGCSCKIVGHGVEAEGEFYCSAHCARTAGCYGVSDRGEELHSAASS